MYVVSKVGKLTLTFISGRLQELLSLVQVWQKQDQGQAAQQTLSDLTLGPGYESKTFDPDQAFKDLYRKLYGYQKYNDEQVVKLRHVQEQFADMHDKQMEVMLFMTMNHLLPFTFIAHTESGKGRGGPAETCS